MIEHWEDCGSSSYTCVGLMCWWLCDNIYVCVQSGLSVPTTAHCFSLLLLCKRKTFRVILLLIVACVGPVPTEQKNAFSCRTIFYSKASSHWRTMFSESIPKVTSISSTNVTIIAICPNQSRAYTKSYVWNRLISVYPQCQYINNKEISSQTKEKVYICNWGK